MLPDYPEMNDVLRRIKVLCEERGWTRYRLSKQSGIPTSSISNMFKRNTQPSLETIHRLCSAFQISISDFFDAPTVSQPDLFKLEKRESVVIELFRTLTPKNKEHLEIYLHGLADRQVPDELM